MKSAQFWKEGLSISHEKKKKSHLFVAPQNNFIKASTALIKH